MRKIAVIGAGVVGSALARELAGTGTHEVTVLERSPAGALSGSTEYAPGFIGLYNEDPTLTDLARTSAQIYESLGTGFTRTGGVEVATSTTGARELASRAAAAGKTGLAVEELDPASAAELAPSVIDPDQVVRAWKYPQDGSGQTRQLTAALRDAAATGGARFLYDTTVNGLHRHHSTWQIHTSRGNHVVDEVVLTGGVWGPQLAGLVGIELPLFPVAHPYVYSPSDSGHIVGPFVRWPEHHVYARVHGNRLGIGSYDHAPQPVTRQELENGANLPWPGEPFDTAITTAMELLPHPSRFTPQQRVNGVFAMTPDNLPLVGAHPTMPGLWSAQAVWVTHASGTARALAAAMTGDQPLPPALDPDRFHNTPQKELRSAALRLYRDIYANDATR